MQALLIALSTYCSLPLPQRQWPQADLSRVLCWLPLVGLLVGAAQTAWLWLCATLGWGLLLSAVGAALLPLLVSGGIHMDGFCDTVDALSSHQPPAQKRQILHDPRAGAFAIIGGCGYLLLQTALLSEVIGRAAAAPLDLPWRLGAALTACSVLARAGCCLQIVRLPRYSDQGMLAAFSCPMSARAVRLAAWLWLAAALGLLLWLDVASALAAAVLLALFSWCFGRMVRREFQGMSGDLAGFYVQLAEMLGLLALLLSQSIGG